MSPERWAAVEALFDAVADLAPEERAQQLRLADPDLRDEVLSLLGAGPLTLSLSGAIADTAATATALEERRFGPWRIVGIIGHGGMGSVYRAQRDDQAFDKQVALKVLQAGIDSPQARERFQQERSILAGLEHPNIARLIDGGETDSGLSYIAMELVEGTSLTHFAANLSRAAKLKLFLDICSAVSYAHQNLVVHRDLKPSNILVTQAGVPKLLDFGIAKLMEPSALKTMTGFQALTPQYASPEQIRGEQVTTASDVYSLGLILYELLTDRRPYDVDVTSVTEIAHAVCERPPDAPNIDGDLDNILFMALRKEASRRYSSVADFSADIERVLTHRPVKARPDSIAYKAQKFLRRNALAVAFIAALSIALIVAVQQARIAQTHYREVRQIARNMIFDVYDDVALVPGATKARETIVATGLRYLEGLRGQTESDSDLALEMAEAYLKLGDVLGGPRTANLGRFAEAKKAFAEAESLTDRVAAKTPKKSTLPLVRAKVLYRLAAIANSALNSDDARKFITSGRQALALVPDTEQDWQLLVHFDHESRYLAQHEMDGTEVALAVAKLQEHAAQWLRVHPEDEARYWRVAAIDMQATAYFLLGRPSDATRQYQEFLVQAKRELQAGNSVVWLSHDMDLASAFVPEMASSPYWPSRGDPQMAVALWRVFNRTEPVDTSNNRRLVSDIKNGVIQLTSLSLVEPELAQTEFGRLLPKMKSSESGTFDATDWANVYRSAGRAARLLGHRDQARELLAEGLRRALTDGSSVSAVVAHAENLLRFELALLGESDPVAIAHVETYQAKWPHALLLQADAVKILSVMGRKQDAQRVLDTMRPSEYTTRIQNEFKSGKFLD